MRRSSSYREFDKSCIRAEMKEKYPFTGGLMTYDAVRRYAQILSTMIIMSIPGATQKGINPILSSPDFLLKAKKMQESAVEVLSTVAVPVIKTQ